MRKIKMIVIHCSATPPDKDFPLRRIRAIHLAAGFNDIGYHFYITRDGQTHCGRAVGLAGAHAKGHNAESIGICYEGGLDETGKPADTRTPAQRSAMDNLVLSLLKAHTDVTSVLGHRDLSPDSDGDGTVEPTEWVKACPCFDARNEYDWLLKKLNRNA